MALSPGTRLGPYEVVSAIGAGGMGEVYRAADTKLKRQVAIKILPPSLTADHDRLARFQREAEVLASLNHPNIAAIYGLEESGGMTALVMELVEGDDLSQRLARGAMPLDEALPIAKQIAEALEVAHEQGIIHRDLKPANIKVRTDGAVKVLDFGLAKTMEPAGREPSVSQSPTITTPAMTQAGMILGTAAYMSPEQAAGTPLDRRTDIWSYGVVLWEMLRGRRLFGGDTVAHTLADVLRSSIDFDTLAAPEPIKRLLVRCLDRNAKTRLRDIGEARVAIATYLADPTSRTGPSRRPTHAYQWLAWAGAAALAILAMAGWLRPRPDAPGAVAADVAFTIAPTAERLSPVGDLHATPQISPDGSAVIFYGDNGAPLGASGVHVQRLNTLTPEPIRTGGFRNPGFWSPDSRSMVFSDGTNLKKMRVPDGAPEVIAAGIATIVGGSWSDSGTLLIPAAASGRGPGTYAVPAAGGDPQRIDVTGLPQDRWVWWPEFLPGSDDFLFLAVGQENVEEAEIYLATLRDGRGVDPVLLMKNATAAHYSPAGGGRLLFVRNDNLYAQTLDRTARILKGDPELIQQRVASSPSFYVAHFSVSRTGVVAWRSGTAGLSQVTIFDRQGKAIGTAGPPTIVQTLTLAPDETRLLVGYNAASWLVEPGRPGRQRLEQPVSGLRWSQDGSRFLGGLFGSGLELRVVERPVSGDGTVRELRKLPGMGRLDDVSPDGKTLLVSRGALDTTVFSVLLDDAKKEPRSLIQTGETIAHARFSPDGQWIVYTASSSASGGGNVYSGGGIYIQPYPGPGFRRQVASRGNYPVWRKDGREIVYLDEYQGRNYIWSIPVATSGAQLRAGAATPLFPARLPSTTFGDLNFLAVTRDGSRFYIPQGVEQPQSEPIHIRMGWAR